MTPTTQCSVLAVASDTGGAQVIAALVRSELHCYRWATAAPNPSPAWALFGKYVPGCTVYDIAEHSAAAIIESVQPDILLTATSVHNTELPFLCEARRRSIRSVSVLDHWINYRERFGFPAQGWQQNLPDIVCATDGVALELAQAVFPRVEPLKNYYIADTARRFFVQPTSLQRTLLVLSQVVSSGNTSAHGTHQTVVAEHERRVLLDILNNFEKLAGFLGVEQLVVRLHPAQRAALYSELCSAYPVLVIEPATSCELVESLQRARIVVGCSSMALFTATALGCETYSFTAGVSAGLPSVGRYVFASADDIIQSKCALSPFANNSVYTGDSYSFERCAYIVQHNTEERY